jgi:hypothetical protein
MTDNSTGLQPIPLTEASVLGSLEAARAARRAALDTGRLSSSAQDAALAAFNPTTIAAGATAAVDAAVDSFKARCAATLAECGALNKENWALRAMAEILLDGQVSDAAKDAFRAYLAPGGRV